MYSYNGICFSSVDEALNEYIYDNYPTNVEGSIINYSSSTQIDTDTFNLHLAVDNGSGINTVNKTVTFNTCVMRPNESDIDMFKGAFEYGFITMLTITLMVYAVKSIYDFLKKL